MKTIKILKLSTILFLLFIQCSEEPAIIEEPNSEPPFECPNEITDIDGNSYKIVTIGDQCWMAENLRTTTFPDGTSIPKGTPEETLSFETPEIFYFDFDEEYPSDIADFSSLNEHLSKSKFYTFLAATNSQQFGNENEVLQGICPDGWRLPNLEDWQVLVEFAGDDVAALNLKSDKPRLWYDVNSSSFENGTNQFGFDAEPNGVRSHFGFDTTPGTTGLYWSSTTNSDNNAMTPVFSSGLDWVQFVQRTRSVGLCVRCVKTE